jgi:thymidylate synthase (FAD)
MLELKEQYTDASAVYADIHMTRAAKYLVFTDILGVDFASVVALENLRLMLQDGVSNDRAKFCLPESYKTELTWTINARSLQNFISLRSSKAALWEIRDLAVMIFDTLPSEHQYLFTSCVSND